MLSAFIEMKVNVNKNKYLDSSSNGLTEFVLLEAEWEAIEDLVLVLKVCFVCADWISLTLYQILKDATQFFSSQSPNISAVIPAMDKINETFTTSIVNECLLSAPLCHALLIGKRAMNKYYQLTDNSDIYRISMGIFFYFCLLLLLI